MKKVELNGLTYDLISQEEMKKSLGGKNDGCLRYFSCSRCGWSAWVNVCMEVARCGCGYQTPLQ